MAKNGITHVVIVGGGFAGVATAKGLAGKQGVRVTLLDKNGEGLDLVDEVVELGRGRRLQRRSS